MNDPSEQEHPWDPVNQEQGQRCSGFIHRRVDPVVATEMARTPISPITRFKQPAVQKKPFLQYNPGDAAETDWQMHTKQTVFPP